MRLLFFAAYLMLVTAAVSVLTFFGPGVQLQRERERYQALVSNGGVHVAVIYAMKGK